MKRGIAILLTLTIVFHSSTSFADIYPQDKSIQEYIKIEGEYIRHYGVSTKKKVYTFKECFLLNNQQEECRPLYLSKYDRRFYTEKELKKMVRRLILKGSVKVAAPVVIVLLLISSGGSVPGGVLAVTKSMLTDLPSIISFMRDMLALIGITKIPALVINRRGPLFMRAFKDFYNARTIAYKSRVKDIKVRNYWIYKDLLVENLANLDK